MEHGYYGNAVEKTPMQFRSNQTEVAPPPLGRISEALSALSRVSENLHQEVVALEQRLSGVLRPTGPAGGSSPTPAKTTPSPLASGLEETHERFYALLGRLQDIAARVDL